jgi:hypothetical protein
MSMPSTLAATAASRRSMAPWPLPSTALPPKDD